jgi:hypothetical protein
MCIALIDGPVFWALAALVCLGISIGLIVFLATSLANKKSGATTAQAMPPAPGSRIYQFSRNGTTVGSFPEGTVPQLIASGQILPDDDCWTHGMSNWQKVSAQPLWKRS